MEISKGLQLEIQSVQSKLKNAIRDHQIYVGKLKDDPNNSDILDRIQEIQVHIVSLGRCQKQVVQRLRKEVDDFKAANANEVKVSVASLLGLNNNNNHITANNESTNDDISEVRVVTNGLDNVRLANAKEDYEEIVRNGDVTSHRENSLKKERSISVETLSADDEEIIEVSVEDDTRENKRQMSEEPLDERRIKCTEQLSFLEVLGLITTMRFTELQNRRAERKRRSTANPQFVYSNWEMPTKRKRHNYLQSAGNVPQTRQTTARLNGPSPPPICPNKSVNLIVPPKSTSPPTRTISKSLIPTQKASTRPNILRNMSESRVFPNKITRVENGNGQSAFTCTTTKTSQSTNSIKSVHIPGLPAGLTIERVDNDSAVCINCRNPGSLTNCDNCEANYHVSCHSTSPPPTRLCPKCALKTKEGTIKKNDELAAASYAPGVAGKAGQDPKIDKASCGFYKIGTITKSQIVAAGRCINELSGSSFVIPIATNAIATTVSLPRSDGIIAAVDDATLDLVESDSESGRRGLSDSGNLPFTRTIVVNNQFSRSSVTYVPQYDSSNLSSVYKLPIRHNEPRESRVYEKIEESGFKGELLHEHQAGENETRAIVNEYNRQQGKITGANNSIVGGISDEGKDIATIKITDSTGQKLNKLTERLAESISRGWKRSTTPRAVPGLTRIVQTFNKQPQQRAIPFDHGNNDNLDELQGCSYNGEPTSGRATTTRLEQLLKSGDSGATDQCRNENECRVERVVGKYEKLIEVSGERNKIEIPQTESLFSRGKYRSNSGPVQHSLFASYNKPDPITDRNCESKQSEGTSSRGVSGAEARGGGKNYDYKFSRDEPIGDDESAESSKVSSSAEHVKLEEAHLSAPSRAKLMRNDENETLTSGESDPPNRLNFASRLFPNRRRTTEDRGSATTNTFPRESYKLTRPEPRQVPRILMRSERKSLDSPGTVNNEGIVETSFGVADFTAFRRNYSESFVRLPAKNPPPEIESSSDTSATDEASSPVAMFDGNLKSILTVDEEIRVSKVLTTSEETEINEDIVSPGNLEVDEETEDNEEDIEEDQDCPIVDEEIVGGGAIEELRIGTVSPESMQVLEQFESAMMQENGDKIANP